MSFPRHLSIRIAAVISILVIAVLIVIRSAESRLTADPWYQLREAFVDEVSLAELRPRLRSAMENISANQPAQDMELFLNVWQSLEGLKQQPSAAGVELAVRNWLDYAVAQPHFDLDVVQRFLAQNSIEISADKRSEIQLRLQRRLGLLHAQITQLDDLIMAADIDEIAVDGDIRLFWDRLFDADTFPLMSWMMLCFSAV